METVGTVYKLGIFAGFLRSRRELGTASHEGSRFFFGEGTASNVSLTDGVASYDLL